MLFLQQEFHISASTGGEQHSLLLRRLEVLLWTEEKANKLKIIYIKGCKPSSTICFYACFYLWISVMFLHLWVIIVFGDRNFNAPSIKLIIAFLLQEQNTMHWDGCLAATKWHLALTDSEGREEQQPHVHISVCTGTYIHSCVLKGWRHSNSSEN